MTDIEVRAEKRIEHAGTIMLLDFPWFGTLYMKLDKVARWDIPTMAVDGTHLFYNPEFTLSLSDSELIGVLAHEVFHCGCLHPYRRGARNPDKWNRAADFTVNAELIRVGFILPKDCLYDPKYLGLSAETVYAQLPDNPPDNGQGNKPLSTGTVMDAPSTPQAQSGKSDISNHVAPESGAPSNAQTSGKGNSLTAEDWAIAVEQATNATNKAGKTPGDASRSAKQARESQEDWREELREFISHVQPSDYSWASPNRRYIADGLYLPGIVKENMGSIGLCMDTSGSISAKVFDVYVSELKALLSEAQPESVIVAYADTKVRNVQAFFPDDLEIKLEARGGGGTKFQPALDYFCALDNPPACLIYFTDLDNGAEKLVEPDYPVLWVTGKAVTRIGQFGKTLQVDGF